MDLSGRLREIERRLYAIETVSRLRSASISEGVTEFTGTGRLSIGSGGEFVISDGGAINGGSWELGVNPDGTSYANVGDMLLHSHDAAPVTEYISLDSVPVDISQPITKVAQPIPEGAASAVVVGALTVMADEEIRSIVRVRSADIDISMVVLEGQTQSIPLLMEFNDTIEFELHVTDSYEVDASFEAIYNWEVPDESKEESVSTESTE